MKKIKLIFCFFIFSCSVAYADPAWRSALSLGNVPKYGADFKHYDYVNVNAPKGGQLNESTSGTFNSFNPYIAKGTAAAGLSSRSGGDLYDTLMAQSTEEPSVNYPLIAEAAQYPDDFSWVKFRLNPNAKWHDGTPISVDDVIWSFDMLKKISPFFNNYYHSVKSAKKTGENEVLFTFQAAGNRELPYIMGQLPILPKRWWEATGANGKKRDITDTTLEVPLGSGPYEIGDYNIGKFVILKRVKNYWAQNLPVNVGRNNFDRKRYSYFMDPNAEWEAFKKGGVSDWRVENRIQRWKQSYGFDAVKRGDVILRSFPSSGSGGAQGYFLNTRRPQLADVRVRKALNLALNFNFMNKALFFNEYHRITSYFQGLSLAATGVPEGEELKILDSVRNEVPAEIFKAPFTLPVYNESGDTRKYLTEAMVLLNEAGWHLKNNQLVNKDNQPFVIEFLLNSPAFEAPTAPYIANLRRLGIDATMRVVDASQYQNRQSNFDFDAVVMAIGQSDSPGNEQLEFWGSAAADKPGGYNLSGIKNPAIDTLINRVIYAKNRDELVAATKALDRVLLWNYYIVPQWSSDHINIAYWNKFSIPEPQPAASGIDLASWWIDPAKEARLNLQK